MELREIIETRFGAALFARPLFHSRDEALRFELSEGGSWIDQMSTAMRKAQVLAADVFATQPQFVACLRMHTAGNTFAIRELVRELGAARIPVPAQRALWSEPVAADDRLDEDVAEHALTLAFPVPVERLQNLLWCALARDLGIRPRLRCAVYLLNPATGVALFPYDDRGMDVIGPRPELARLYSRHFDWLLRHDLARMQQTFAAE